MIAAEHQIGQEDDQNRRGSQRRQAQNTTLGTDQDKNGPDAFEPNRPEMRPIIRSPGAGWNLVECDGDPGRAGQGAQGPLCHAVG